MINVYPIKFKSDCYNQIIKYRKIVEIKSGRKIRILQLDGDGE